LKEKVLTSSIKNYLETTPMIKKTTITAILLLFSRIAFSQEVISTKELSLKADHLWILFCAALVFLMQAGFKAFETGMVQYKHRNSIGLKNIMDWLIVFTTFFLFGFGVMFGHSAGGFIGTDLYLLEGVKTDLVGGLAFFLFQVTFAGTACTIVSGAMSERTGFVSYVVVSLFIAIFIYPLVGHWIWGSSFYEGNQAWLYDMGFRDFAGGTVVHTTGAWIALVGVYMVGPRIGRYDADGKKVSFKSNNLSYSALGLFLLWFGWWGFNGGSTLQLNFDVFQIILVTNIAGAFAGISSFIHSYFFQNKDELVEKIMGGILGGLVAITPCALWVGNLEAILIGLIAGVLHNFASDLLSKKMKLDDPDGAIPVHGACGIWGTLCVGLFGDLGAMGTNLTRLEQIGVQGLGITVTCVFTLVMGYLIFALIKSTIGLRISAVAEKEGSGYFSDGQRGDSSSQLDAQAIIALMKDLDTK
jgi:Amt family ammonium transporter